MENYTIGDIFYYDESSPTGLRHRIDRQNVKKDSVAGSRSRTYSHVRFYGRFTPVHRLIWELHFGDIPDGMVIDHIDGDIFNNLIGNLRLIPEILNHRNKRKHRNNRSGFIGVSFNKNGSWVASWYDESGKQKYKYFSLANYDYITAKMLAIKFRETQIALLNSKGFGYTERHGL